MIILDNVSPGGRVAVAMSGGVDSSVAAALMVEAGYQVVGITLQLYDHGQMINKKGACCAGQDIYDARTVADRLGFPHYVLDYESVFRQGVIDDFAESYMQGETPVPCIRCNQRVKFRDLLTTARDLGAEALVTGHYVQRFSNPNGAQLHRAVDPNRDQSYFLFATTQEQLDYLRFPLGGMEKAETRDHARWFDLAVSEKPDSQDICFVPSGGYAAVVAKLRPGALDPGEIVDLQGVVLGQHQGIINFTVGQRRGLGVSAADPLYVIRLEPEAKRVVVGPHEALAKHELLVKEVNWLADPRLFEQGHPCQIKIRSTHQPVDAMVHALPDHKAKVFFSLPEYGVSSGQACVFYDQGQVLGGGWISSKG
ncbi:tRNA 2-thiouridine(34) synthase MnmA [Candidatus Finniella inopinata]|uniref:tRNA-specific 2-thiouridylase MnmA n=1 Tax=Candidatus Finniella inopinata TaxID=1696036 RepID=A0A4Q7DPC4_9PROT|nr:tRNA 2-thiouridine(34) synthase MnmA [Candidatus Finniella inopinata]RZI46836.1 tRNA 2-thiouridine(34) synthase MnmA [Candidatus Finniella inopinata]